MSQTSMNPFFINIVFVFFSQFLIINYRKKKKKNKPNEIKSNDETCNVNEHNNK